MRTVDTARVGTADAIRSAAVELFANHGYEATTVNAIGRSVGIRGSAIYNHVMSKQELLRDIMFSSMLELVSVVAETIDSADGHCEKLRLGVCEHVRFHVHRRLEFRVGNREIPSLEEPSRTELVGIRRQYVRMFQNVIEAGAAEGLFEVRFPLIATYSILQSAMGVAIWYEPEADLTDVEIADLYGEFALRTVGYRG